MHRRVIFCNGDTDVQALCFQAGGLGDRLAESAASATDPLARQGAFESYTALMKDIGNPIEPFIAGVLSIIFDKCSDKVGKLHHHLPLRGCLPRPSCFCHSGLCWSRKGVLPSILLDLFLHAAETASPGPDVFQAVLGWAGCT